jgi:hypothetical protein
MNLFCIEKGFYSRTEIGEREIDGNIVYIMNAVKNKTFCDPFTVLPVSLSLSPPFSVSQQARRGLIKNIHTICAEHLGILEKIRNDPKVIFRGLGEDDL